MYAKFSPDGTRVAYVRAQNIYVEDLASHRILPLTADGGGDIVNGLIHRTASVCCVNRPKRFVVYQVFGDLPGGYYAEDLERLASEIAAQDRITFLVLGCAFRSTEAYAQLKARWDGGERNLAEDVRDALLAGPLLEFSQPVAIPIQPAA